MKSVLGNPIIVFTFLVIFPPLGIFLMFTFTDWSSGMKMALAVVFGLVFIAAVVTTMQEFAQNAARKSMDYISNVKMTM